MSPTMPSPLASERVSGAMGGHGWHGRGVRTNHPEDCPQYVKGCDIASFDIYPTHNRPQVAGKFWYVGQGVQRLVNWTEGQKPVWCCIETTHINKDIGRAAVECTQLFEQHIQAEPGDEPAGVCSHQVVQPVIRAIRVARTRSRSA